ncbi:MAG TPA: ABC transporter permease, partial [Candidatus Acidoferrum sp.]|nr:ABC transporter permease [Candidatus Acidoferrum sp.]
MAELARELESRDFVDLAPRPTRARQLRYWSALWPQLLALLVAVALWQVVVLSGWRPASVLPGPLPVFHRLFNDLTSVDFYAGVSITLLRAGIGYGVAVVAGTAIGLLVARVTFLRRALGSALLGLQSMPSISWFPLAILLFQRSEPAIILVVLLGAAPAIANGLLSGVDHVEPLLVRVGRVMGARGLGLYRHVILPAALPSFVGGLKQGWAFAWRSLMAGELILRAFAGQQHSLGQQLRSAQDLSD